MCKLHFHVLSSFVCVCFLLILVLCCLPACLPAALLSWKTFHNCCLRFSRVVVFLPRVPLRCAACRLAVLLETFISPSFLRVLAVEGLRDCSGHGRGKAGRQLHLGDGELRVDKGA